MDETRIESSTPTTAEARADGAPREPSLAHALKSSAAIAAETAALAAALARLASSEAQLSARSLAGAFGWRALAAVALVPVWILLVVAVVAVLVPAVGLALACTVVAVAHGIVALFAYLRARALSARVGFARTRAVLAELAAPESPP